MDSWGFNMKPKNKLTLLKLIFLTFQNLSKIWKFIAGIVGYQVLILHILEQVSRLELQMREML